MLLQTQKLHQALLILLLMQLMLIPATVSKVFAITIINAPCSPTTDTIAEIQGAGNLSPLVGNVETTSGIVTGIRSNGFFMQTPDASADADPLLQKGFLYLLVRHRPQQQQLETMFVFREQLLNLFLQQIRTAHHKLSSLVPYVTLLSSGNPLPACDYTNQLQIQICRWLIIN